MDDPSDGSSEAQDKVDEPEFREVATFTERNGILTITYK